jgi:RES domain
MVCDAPRPALRLIPSQFPPIGLFDTVATAADLDAVMELAGWTNDRLVQNRINRLPVEERVYGIPNASVIMAAFLHVAPGGSRFNGEDLGGWYAADDLRTAAAEVGHHLRREVFARNLPSMTRRYRCYASTLLGRYEDIRHQQANLPDLYDPASYAASQHYGEAIRAAGGNGIVYDSVRRKNAACVFACRPRNITEVTQADHYEITAIAHAPRIEIVRL